MVSLSCAVATTADTAVTVKRNCRCNYFSLKACVATLGHTGYLAEIAIERVPVFAWLRIKFRLLTEGL
jgi:hypothetical protein